VSAPLPPLHLVLGWSDWANLFGHYLLLSLMSVGGAISTTPEMHRYLVEQHHWLTQAQFNESIALAQAAPGPNVLFVALMGWNVGLNAGSMGAALLGVGVTMLGIMIPSTVVTYVAAQWGHRNRELRAVRAFKQGMAPIVIALLLSTSFILGAAGGNPARDWPLWLLALASGLVIWRTRIHLLWVLAAGALVGWLQLV
jgi:chromate transporter